MTPGMFHRVSDGTPLPELLGGHSLESFEGPWPNNSEYPSRAVRVVEPDALAARDLKRLLLEQRWASSQDMDVEVNGSAAGLTLRWLEVVCTMLSVRATSEFDPNRSTPMTVIGTARVVTGLLTCPEASRSCRIAASRRACYLSSGF